MSGQVPDTTDQSVRELIAAMPEEFWSFHRQYDRAYYEYSRIQLGNDEAARHLVNMTFVYLAAIWPRVAGNPGRHAWALLKQRVAAELAAGAFPDGDGDARVHPCDTRGHRPAPGELPLLLPCRLRAAGR